MKLLIAIPCMDTLPTAFVESFISMQKPENTNVRFWKNSLVHDARNLLALTAINEGYDYVMWLDSDMICPQDTIPRLLHTAQGRGAEMVTGLYVKRTYPTEPLIYKHLGPPVMRDGKLVSAMETYTDYPVRSVFQVEGCGFGCVLTSVPLLKRVWDKFAPAFHPLQYAGEDLAFCMHVKGVGETILCDSSISCGHIGTFCYTEQMLKGSECQ